ncbi:tRNA (adenosine(37)-N6)-threonylcarbamoyltransferase complex ATPase subunit type 1 TsaE [Pelagibacterales bacterium SAG-MED13]|nr:tRNA (adenosine(37)-N6)-threonylcarbamoyltransferase complex ATPase subunit type 1 TsaE [Pelagibacterales bacterium SAG-MED13]
MPTATNIDLSSEYKTEELANNIQKKIKIGDVLYLYGEMGVGKTTFVKYLINKFQKENKINQTEVTSPTFNILNEYQIKKFKINHYDLFRLKKIEELKNLNLFEDNSNIITLIEWPQIIKKKPKNLIEISFEYKDDYKKRSVNIKGLDL